MASHHRGTEITTVTEYVTFITSCGSKAQQTPPPCCASRHRDSRGFSELTKNLIRSSHGDGHSTPSMKISCNSVQPFSRNLADKETKKEINKEINKEIDRKQYPVPDTVGSGVKMFVATMYFVTFLHAIACKLTKF